ncbi:MAG: MurR/RpiR family transcriptional regulator [Erysipelotrichaceae bacterium]|nr:MurR/RpiR family transcriptional regulator [Erysipelotrichaceae bacterium]MBR3352309.1 MurR/RpiR family transcriptional regulator [Erysipelotrichaceae bacterium]
MKKDRRIAFNILTSLLSIMNQNDESNVDCVLAKYLLEHLNEIPKLSIYKLADACYVSRSSIHRFVRSCGYESFREFKKASVDADMHRRRFIQYTDFTDYPVHLKYQTMQMMEDVTRIADSEEMNRTIEAIHDSREVVFLVADDSSSPVRVFQQQMTAVNKIIRVLTSSNTNLSMIDSLTDKDLLVVCSISGNFAIIINDDIHDMSMKKILLTTNRTTLFSSSYDTIFYLSSYRFSASSNLVASQNIYTAYSLSYFLDLLFHFYYVRYQSELKKDPH